jgi:putative transposase
VVHRHYAGHIHARLKRTGHFWQGRFGCVAMDEAHFGAALRYVALNPVRAGLVARASDWPWSSTRALRDEADDGITVVQPVLSRYPDFAALLAAGEDEELRLRKAEQIGRPIGDTAFLDRLESVSGRTLRRGRPGSRPRQMDHHPNYKLH